MAKRRTSGIQRRGRASEAALNRRVAASGERGGALDPRVLLIGGVLVVGLVILVVVLLFGGSGASGGIGTRMASEGATHVDAGTIPTYISRPATSGPHWNLGDGIAPVNWGVYTTPQAEPAVVHNLEHGGIAIWYQPSQLDATQVEALDNFVRQQNTTSAFKVLVSPWSGEDFGHPIAVTAWTWLLYLDTADTDAIRQFVSDHYGDAPEPLGGPGRPAG